MNGSLVLDECEWPVNYLHSSCLSLQASPLSQLRSSSVPFLFAVLRENKTEYCTTVAPLLSWSVDPEITEQTKSYGIYRERVYTIDSERAMHHRGLGPCRKGGFPQWCCRFVFFPAAFCTSKNHWETKGRFRKRVVLANVPLFRFSFGGGGGHANVPSFRFSFRGNIRMYPRSGFHSGGTSAKTTLLENHPFVNPRKSLLARVLLQPNLLQHPFFHG